MKQEIAATTVFCADPSPAAVAALLSREPDVEFDTSESNWSTIRVRRNDQQMTVSRRMFSGAGGEFSKAILGMHNHVQNWPDLDEDLRSQLLQTVENCDMMLGVRLDPPAKDDSDFRLALISAIARQTRGFVFDGSAIWAETLS